MQCNVTNCRRSGTSPYADPIQNNRIPLPIHIIPGKGVYLSGGFGFLHDFYRFDRDLPYLAFCKLFR